MKVKVILEALYNAPDSTDLRALPCDIMKHGLGPEEAVAYTKVVVKEVAGRPECPSCGAVLTEIPASRDYTISYSEEQSRWVKEDGDAYYGCGNCLERLDVCDIEDILRQVDEL